MRKGILILAALLFTASCGAPIRLAEPNKRVTAAEVYSVQPATAWNRMGGYSTEQWTMDGTSLQSIVFFRGIADGKPMFRQAKDKTLPVFRSSMTPIEIKDLFATSMSRLDYQNLKVRKFRPAKVGGVNGFRFDFSLTTEGGLKKRGFAVGAIRNKTLYFVFYWGTRLHYYAKNRRDAERVIGSLRWAKAKG
jgi:hypothetical protein